MSLRLAAFLADENIQAAVVQRLRDEDQLDIATVEGLGLIGAADLTLLQLSVDQQRVILTHDSDFGRLAIAQKQPVHGILYVRPGSIDADFTLQTIRTALDHAQQPEPPFVMVAARNRDNIRIRLRLLQPRS